MPHKLCSYLIAVVAAIGINAAAVAADPGVSADKIVFGQVAALEGPASALGQGMRDGIKAAFAEVNKVGGVKGRILELVSMDDSYEPTRSIGAVKTLIDEDKVFALIGSVGTPTSATVEPIAAEAHIPFVGPFTGAEFLRDPGKTHVVNVRASYFQETEAMVLHLTEDLGVKHIAIFYQDDSFGQAGLAGVKRALEKRGMALVAEGTYERNTTAVKGGLLAVQKGRPEAVIMVGAYKPCAEFIKLARQINLDSVFVNISFVGSDALAKELGPAGAGVVVTQVVPFPNDTTIPLVTSYQAALKSANPSAEPGFVSLEGYMVGRLVVAALGKIDGEITRKALLETIDKTGTFDLGGITLTYGPGNNRGSAEVFLTVIQPDGSFRAVTKLPKASG